jgi:flagellar protein FlbD
MIRLTRINQVPLVLNSDLIEHIETTPDTVITMTNGQKFVVLESTDQVVERVIAFRRAVDSSFVSVQADSGEDARRGMGQNGAGSRGRDAEGTH